MEEDSHKETPQGEYRDIRSRDTFSVDEKFNIHMCLM